VLKDYAEQLHTPRLLTRSLPTVIPYELVPEQQIRASFLPRKRWDSFYERYPSSRGGFYWFSAVGFDSQRTHAIVEMNHVCGTACGGGYPQFFEKIGGKWREVSVNATTSGWAL
jgi:hypothetical protein